MQVWNCQSAKSTMYKVRNKITIKITIYADMKHVAMPAGLDQKEQ